MNLENGLPIYTHTHFERSLLLCVSQHALRVNLHESKKNSKLRQRSRLPLMPPGSPLAISFLASELVEAQERELTVSALQFPCRVSVKVCEKGFLNLELMMNQQHHQAIPSAGGDFCESLQLNIVFEYVFLGLLFYIYCSIKIPPNIRFFLLFFLHTADAVCI